MTDLDPDGAVPGTVIAFAYEGAPIRKLGQRLNLTDMWRAAGSPANRRPAKWLQLQPARHFRSKCNLDQYSRTPQTESFVAAKPGRVGRNDMGPLEAGLDLRAVPFA